MTFDIRQPVYDAQVAGFLFSWYAYLRKEVTAMNTYVTGNTIRKLRESKHLTQSELGERIGVSDKAVSKWETGKGLPDLTLIQPLAQALDVSVIELMNGEQIINRNRSCNVIRSRLYVCPICGNVIHCTGDAVVSCCGDRPQGSHSGGQ